MKILLLTVDSPFIRGGAEIMLDQLHNALYDIGHKVEIIRLPFTYGSSSNISAAMDYFERLDLTKLDAGSADRIISLKFPTYYAYQETGRVWLMHQHRPFYDLWDDAADHPESARALRQETVEKDTRYLSQYEHVFTISQNVSKRLQKYNGVASQPIYQPPQCAERFNATDNLPFIFCPSRIESLKRQELLIRAMPHVRSTMVAVIAGTGGQYLAMCELAKELGVSDRIMFTGEISQEELIRYYGLCRGVFFAPFDEDYGFVTLEAMLSAKPVVTCTDSGGPLEFVNDGVNGFIVMPEPLQIAAAIDRLGNEPALAKRMGQNGLSLYQAMQLSWPAIADRLVV